MRISKLQHFSLSCSLNERNMKKYFMRRNNVSYRLVSGTYQDGRTKTAIAYPALEETALGLGFYR